MFDEMHGAALAGVAELDNASNADLLTSISAHHRMQSVHAAAELVAIADLHNRYEYEYDAGIEKFVIDREDLLAGDVAAALNISHGRALGLVDTG